MSDTSEVMRRGAWYPVENRGDRVAAKWDGKPKRCPRAGEYYLSGAVITAYRAYNDLNTEFYIAEVWEVETERVTFPVKRIS